MGGQGLASLSLTVVFAGAEFENGVAQTGLRVGALLTLIRCDSESQGERLYCTLRENAQKKNPRITVVSSTAPVSKQGLSEGFSCALACCRNTCAALVAGGGFR